LAQNPEGFYMQTITIFTMHRLKSGFFGTDLIKFIFILSTIDIFIPKL